MSGLGWLGEYSEKALRSALRVVDVGLASRTIELTGTNDLSRPTWASGSAMIDGCMLAKFAFSEPTAVRLWHEARVLELLGARAEFEVPELVAAWPNPAFLVTGGVPLSCELVRDSIPARVGEVGAELARFHATRFSCTATTSSGTSGRCIYAWSRTSKPVARPRPSMTSVRTEAALQSLLARPGGGTPAEYVQELSERFALLRIGP